MLGRAWGCRTRSQKAGKLHPCLGGFQKGHPWVFLVNVSKRGVPFSLLHPHPLNSESVFSYICMVLSIIYLG